MAAREAHLFRAFFVCALTCVDARIAVEMNDLLPLFVSLTGRRVVLVGGGPVAAAKLVQLLAAGAEVLVIAPEVHADILAAGALIACRPFVPADLDGAWLVVAAATPDVNRQVAEAAEPRRVFVNAVDDPANATAFLSGVVRRDGVTLARLRKAPDARSAFEALTAAGGPSS